MLNPFNRGGAGQTPDMSAYDFSQNKGAWDVGQTPGADERVRQALEAEAWPYEISPNHNFRVIVNYSGEGRTQLVFVASQTSAVRGREWRKVWSKAFEVIGRLAWEQALALLLDSDRHARGGWYIEEWDGNTAAFFQVSLPADATPADLEDTIYTVAEVADEMEKATVGTDAN
jgi:hypothetical protein